MTDELPEHIRVQTKGRIRRGPLPDNFVVVEYLRSAGTEEDLRAAMELGAG